MAGIFQGLFYTKMKKTSNLIGLIGGMGPYATSYLYKLLLDKSRLDYGARRNCDYPEVIIDSLPIPDFISDLDFVGVAKEEILSRVKMLTIYGSRKIFMVCNSGHIFEGEMRLASKGRFISLIDLVTNKINSLQGKRIGLLATPTTIKMKLYGQKIKENINLYYPDQKILGEIENVIRGVIAGDTKKENKRLSDLVRKFIEKNKLDTIVLGCTELPVVFPREEFEGIEVIDSLDILASSILEQYYQSGGKSRLK